MRNDDDDDLRGVIAGSRSDPTAVGLYNLLDVSHAVLTASSSQVKSQSGQGSKQSSSGVVVRVLTLKKNISREVRAWTCCVLANAVTAPLAVAGEAGGAGALGPGLTVAALSATVLALRFAAYTRLEYSKAAVLSKYVPKGVSHPAEAALQTYQEGWTAAIHLPHSLRAGFNNLYIYTPAERGGTQGCPHAYKRGASYIKTLAISTRQCQSISMSLAQCVCSPSM